MISRVGGAVCDWFFPVVFLKRKLHYSGQPQVEAAVRLVLLPANEAGWGTGLQLETIRNCPAPQQVAAMWRCSTALRHLVMERQVLRWVLPARVAAAAELD